MKEAIAFATLFLGLTVGVRPVEVLVGRNVASVELRVDGAPIAHLSGEPWTAECDLGSALQPRHLEAVAYSAAGDELGRTSQWLNIPREPAMAEVLMDLASDGRVIARLRSTSLSSEAPDRVRALFDGVPIEAGSADEIVLPPHDPKQLHYLRVDVEFADGLVSTVESTFGGSFVDEVATELTAVPLQLSRPRDESALTSPPWLLTGGREAKVVDVVSGPARLILIRDQSAQADLDRMVRRGNVPYGAVANLKRGYSVEILRPIAHRVTRSQGDLRLFTPEAPLLTSRDGGLLWLLTRIRAPNYPPRLQRLSDAIAVAGVSAASSKHRRAVVLLLGPQPADNGQHAPSDVRRYLETMHVPLFIWSTAGERDTPWGPAADVSTMARFERRTKELTKSVELQRIAWVRGVFQPPEISLGSPEIDIRLAGS